MAGSDSSLLNNPEFVNDNQAHLGHPSAYVLPAEANQWWMIDLEGFCRVGQVVVSIGK